MLTVKSIRYGIAQALSLRQFAFPGGEQHVQVLAPDVAVDSLLIDAHIASSDDVMALLMTTDALRRMFPGKPISLRMPYIPYARQDRVCNLGEPLGARVFCDLINSQGYAQVQVMDPHSDVSTALLNNVVVEDIAPLLKRVVDELGDVALVAPDAGASKRVLNLAKRLGGLPVVFAEKVRDTATGEIKGIRIAGDLPDSKLLVVDDICDGGRTFIELAQALQQKQAEAKMNNPMFLYVTHGIFSRGLEVLTPFYTQIFTANDWTQSNNENLKAISR